MGYSPWGHRVSDMNEVTEHAWGRENSKVSASHYPPTQGLSRNEIDLRDVNDRIDTQGDTCKIPHRYSTLE